MIQVFNTTTARAALGVALGAALLTLAAACSDAPSGLRPRPGPLALDQPVSAASDVPLMEAATLRPLVGERRQRRSLRGADGQVLVVESVVGADGHPRASVITRNGTFLMRIDNEWAPDSPGHLDRQRAYVLGADGTLRSFDSRNVSAAALATARAKLRADAEQLSRPPAGRILRLDEGMSDCDAQVKAADIATWQYVSAAVTVMAASATGNILAASVAYAAYLSSYANYQAKEADLDKCIANIGKKPIYDEY